MQSKRLSRVFSNTTVQKHQFFGAQLSSQSNCPSSVVSVNYRALICCTCHFQSRSLFLVCFGFLCLQVSSAPNFCPDTEGEGGHLFRLTCSVVLQGGRSPANKITGVCGELSVSGHTGFTLLTACVLSRSTLPRLQVALQGLCLRQALGCVHFPGLCRSGSGSRVPHRGTGSVGPAFCALPRSEQLRRSGAWPAHTPQVRRILSSPRPSPLASWVHSGVSGVPCVSSGELISGCDLSDGCQPSRIPGRLG